MDTIDRWTKKEKVKKTVKQLHTHTNRTNRTKKEQTCIIKAHNLRNRQKENDRRPGRQKGRKK